MNINAISHLVAEAVALILWLPRTKTVSIHMTMIKIAYETFESRWIGSIAIGFRKTGCKSWIKHSRF